MYIMLKVVIFRSLKVVNVERENIFFNSIYLINEWESENCKEK